MQAAVRSQGPLRSLFFNSRAGLTASVTRAPRTRFRVVAHARQPFSSASEFLRGFQGRATQKPAQKVEPKGHTALPANQALPTSTLASVDGVTLLDTVLSGSLHAILLAVWIGALGMTLTAALRFVSVSHGHTTVRVVTANTPMVTRALAALVGGLLRLVARVLARNVDLMRLASLGTVTFLINSVTHI